MKIEIDTEVKADITEVWESWNEPEDIKKWNAASEDWHTTSSFVDLREGGKFSSRMEAKDGSMGFDFSGTYTRVIPHELIEYELEDGRCVSVAFAPQERFVSVSQIFDADEVMDVEQQRQGWQSILDNFAKYVESKAGKN